MPFWLGVIGEFKEFLDNSDGLGHLALRNYLLVVCFQLRYEVRSLEADVAPADAFFWWETALMFSKFGSGSVQPCQMFQIWLVVVRFEPNSENISLRFDSRLRQSTLLFTALSSETAD